MKKYIRRQQHKKFKHQDIKQKEPPQSIQGYDLVSLEWLVLFSERKTK